jgi:hypothetical protein
MFRILQVQGLEQRRRVALVEGLWCEEETLKAVIWSNRGRVEMGLVRRHLLGNPVGAKSVRREALLDIIFSVFFKQWAYLVELQI